MIVNAKNTRWADAGRTAIIMDVKLLDENDWVAFFASPISPNSSGPMLYHMALNGAFGEIAPSSEERIIAGELPAPEGHAVHEGKIVNVAEKEREAKTELDRRLAALNSEESKARAEVDDAYAAGRKAHLAALLAVKKQAGWPLAVQWPVFDEAEGGDEAETD